MFYLRALLFGLITVVVVVIIYPIHSIADGQTVVINELMWMGSSASSADEWIELRNLTSAPVDMSGWQLTKKSGGAETPMLTIPAGKTISVEGYFLISNYAGTSTNSTLLATPDVVNTDMALSNSALQVKLYDAAHNIIDVADDGVGNPLSGSYDSAKKIYASMERLPVPGDGTVAESWHAATKSLGFKPGAVELGTPGSRNSNAMPTADAGADQKGTIGQALNFDGSDSSDPENQPLTYQWNFGDGSVSQDVTPVHVYAAAGAYEAVLAVSDGIDAARDTVKITISDAPAAAPITSTESSNPNSKSVIMPPAAPSAPPTGSCLGLRLNEVYPNPTGVDNDEFIELVNASAATISPAGCSIIVGVAKHYLLTADQSIAPGAYLLLPKSLSRLVLTNTGTTVRLLETDQSELDRLTYESAPEGKSWAWLGDAWTWTNQVTPGKKNQAAIAEPTAAGKSSSKTAAKKSSPKKAEPPPPLVSLADVQQLDSGDRVMVRGTVTADKDVLGSGTAVVQSPDGGITVSLSPDSSALSAGQRVELTGTVRLNQGRRKISVAKDGIQVLDTEPVPEPQPLATDDVSPEYADQLVRIKGTVAVASGNRLEVDDGSGPVSVYLKSSTGIVRPKMTMGDTVDATGVVNVSTTGVRMLPRQQADLQVTRAPTATTATATNPPTVISTSSTSQSWWYWLAVGLGGLGAVAKPALSAWRQRREK